MVALNWNPNITVKDANQTTASNSGLNGTMNNFQLVLLAVLTFELSTGVREMKGQQQDTGEHQAYLPPTTPVATGKAPGMKVRLLGENHGAKNYVIVLAKGDEVMSGLTDFARQNKVGSAGFTAIGAFSHATVAWFDDGRKAFKLNPINQQVELVSMTGDIALSGDQPAVHAHVAVASPDGMVKGGHLIEAYVFPTLELFLSVYPTALHKELDDTTGLKLIDPLVK
jgi:hypothetical protein